MLTLAMLTWIQYELIQVVLRSYLQKNSIYIESKPEHNEILSYRQRYPKIVPGNSSYANRTRSGKCVMVTGDSMISGMSGKRLSEEMNNGDAFVKPYLGATAEEMTEFYLQPLFKRGKVDAANLMIGTNNLTKRTVVENDVCTIIVMTALLPYRRVSV